MIKFRSLSVKNSHIVTTKKGDFLKNSTLKCQIIQKSPDNTSKNWNKKQFVFETQIKNKKLTLEAKAPKKGSQLLNFQNKENKNQGFNIFKKSLTNDLSENECISYNCKQNNSFVEKSQLKNKGLKIDDNKKKTSIVQSFIEITNSQFKSKNNERLNKSVINLERISVRKSRLINVKKLETNFTIQKQNIIKEELINCRENAKKLLKNQFKEINLIIKPDLSHLKYLQSILLFLYQKSISQKIFHHKNKMLPLFFRFDLYDWFFSFCNFYKFSNRTFFLSINFIEIYLTKNLKMEEDLIQQIAIGCAFTASKYEEVKTPSIFKLVDNKDSIELILKCEFEIVTILNFEFNRILAFDFFEIFAFLAFFNEKEIKMGILFLHLSSIEFLEEFYPQNVIAFAICCVIAKLLKSKPFFHKIFVKGEFEYKFLADFHKTEINKINGISSVKSIIEPMRFNENELKSVIKKLVISYGNITHENLPNILGQFEELVKEFN